MKGPKYAEVRAKVAKKVAAAAKKHANAGKPWGKPFKKGKDPRRKRHPKGSNGGGGRKPAEVKALLLKEFEEERPLVKARMRLPNARPADHIKYLDLLGKYSPLGQTITVKTEDDDKAPGKLTKEQIAEKLAEILK